MDSTPRPDCGAIITYLNPDALDPTAFLRGVVIGAYVVDPETSHAWVPVLLPDRTLSVLDTRNIIEVQASDGP
ncbi:MULTISPECIES: hypothetical protein [Saccharothrix]|uniref:hypothetical protein n=1 Tax=Saccharothrix TaxID=2071 RepID=UPI00093D7506|nr:hypothetical protein [Saccharothrix sp. CB00851]OKI16118.1 hypothetical protein A6A25_12500 [Saccharothrix sp. CB00851]